MKKHDYIDVFRHITGQTPYPYQQRLATQPWPDLLDIPTGLGKTVAVTLAWLYKRLTLDANTPRRLVICLPMRVLVEQTHRTIAQWLENASSLFNQSGQMSPSLHLLMGGEVDASWVDHPENAAILVGTQDMLLSRALMRGYALSRFQWPIQFALLHNDTLWVFDEVQLMGAGLATSAQLDAFRRIFPLSKPTRSLWVSATLRTDWLATVDLAPHIAGLTTTRLERDDQDDPTVLQRTKAAKTLQQARTTLSEGDLILIADKLWEHCRDDKPIWVVTSKRSQLAALETMLKSRAPDHTWDVAVVWEQVLNPTLQTLYLTDNKTAKKLRLSPDHIITVDQLAINYANALAKEVAATHRSGTTTLAVVNQVRRAQAIYQALKQEFDESVELLLIHARFRPAERRALESRLRNQPGTAGRVIVATQAIEAGVDISSATLFTELAPWSSLVQRFGRCNRYGEIRDAQVYWIDIVGEAQLTRPYESEPLQQARERIKPMRSVAPEDLPAVDDAALLVPVLRRRDLLELFNTDPDLTGYDIDIAQYIRDTADSQLHVFWRSVTNTPTADEPLPARDEFCSVSVGQLLAYFKKTVNKTERHAWQWDSLSGNWRRVRENDVRSGMTLMLSANLGGYSPELGFEPELTDPVIPIKPPTRISQDDYRGDPASQIGQYIDLTQHLGDVERKAAALCEVLGESEHTEPVCLAGRWHDLGKALPAFQNAVLHNDDKAPVRTQQFWAKWPGRGRPYYAVYEGDPPRQQPRPYFRHELGSALAWLPHSQEHPYQNLVAYLIAAHHGKVRMGLRALPNEAVPVDGRRYARGIWEGDILPAVQLPNDDTVPPTALSLEVMELGDSSHGESWLSRTQQLLTHHGPFQLAWLETLVRLADWRASAVYEQEESSQ